MNFMENNYQGGKTYSDDPLLFYALTGLTTKGSYFIKEDHESFHLVLFKTNKVSTQVQEVFNHYDITLLKSFDYADVYYLEKN